jgi:hypothetical protein
MEKIYNKEISLEDNKYNISLINTEHSLEIKIIENEINIYENSFLLEEIKENKFFSIYENINEIYIDLLEYLSLKSPKIKKENNIIKIIIELPSKKVKEIIFTLFLKNDNLNIINNLESEIIRDNISDNILLKNWIDSKKKINSHLLYRMTKDGDSFKIFHTLCDNIKPNLILVKSKKGKKFGGFTFENWESCNEGKWKKDNKCFLFSLDKKKRFFQKDFNNNDNIYCLNIFGPCFSYDLAFKCRNMKKCTSWGNMTYLNNKDLAENDNNNFDVEEVEVFKIEIL